MSYWRIIQKNPREISEELLGEPFVKILEKYIEEFIRKFQEKSYVFGGFPESIPG